ncbi:hypothetical protein [Streptomyces sp. NPDC050164]|uniref:hypothetical protein n=1 Tax=Streptomyces sp. NPDC050164 TaxID=3365605 RepID=UPI00378F7BDC
MPGGCPSEGFKVLLKGYSDPSPENVRALVEIMTYGSSSETDQLIRQRSDTARKRPDHLANFPALARADRA